MTDVANLTREQKEAIFLLQIGTFLEYFDLMLYVHMAVVLNELFFPKTDPKTASVLAAFAFCSTYVLRPFAALIFGYIGDNYGRKPTIMITTTAMALCCFVITFLPTYAEIGITAAVIISVLRIVQGMTSMAEIIGARVYITEYTKPPVQYVVAGFISIAASLGSMCALAIATLTTSTGFNWRYAFGFGVIVALVGIAARTKMRETPDFVDAKLKMQKALEQTKEMDLEKPALLLKSLNPIIKEKIKIMSCVYYTLIYCTKPFSFYLTYIYFTPILKNDCGDSSHEVIKHNFYLSILAVALRVFWVIVVKKVYPLFVSKLIGYCFVIIVLLLPIMVGNEPNVVSIFFIQVLLTIFTLTGFPSDTIFIKYFPIFRRFTAVTFGYALAIAIMHIITSFGLVYLTDWFNYYGIWIIAFPLVFCYLKAITYYENLEKEVGHYPLKGEWQARS
jgi:MFS transporter, MHS family, proline/betaine transporter